MSPGLWVVSKPANADHLAGGSLGDRASKHLGPSFSGSPNAVDLGVARRKFYNHVLSDLGPKLEALRRKANQVCRWAGSEVRCVSH